MINHGALLRSAGYEVASSSSEGSSRRHTPTAPGGGDDAITCLDLCPMGLLLACGHFSGAITLHALSSSSRAKLLVTLCPPTHGPTAAAAATVTALSLSPCGCFLAAGTMGGAVSVIDLRPGEAASGGSSGGGGGGGLRGHSLALLHTHTEHQPQRGGGAITCLCWSKLAAQKLYSGCQGGFVFALDWSPSSPARAPPAALTLALAFAAPKATTLVSRGPAAVSKVEASVADSPDLGGLMDLLLVCAGGGATLYQFPLSPLHPPRMRELAGPSGQGLGQGQGREASGCFSITIDAAAGQALGTGGPGLSMASGLLLLTGLGLGQGLGTGTETGMQMGMGMGGGTGAEADASAAATAAGAGAGVGVGFCDTDGNAQQWFGLPDCSPAHADAAVSAAGEGTGRGGQRACRLASSLQSNDYRHLLLAITPQNQLLLVHLLEMRCWPLSRPRHSAPALVAASAGTSGGLTADPAGVYGDVLAVAAGGGRVVVMLQQTDGAGAGPTADVISVLLLQLVHPTLTSLPLRPWEKAGLGGGGVIVGAWLLRALLRVQERWRGGRERREGIGAGAAAAVAPEGEKAMGEPEEEGETTEVAKEEEEEEDWSWLRDRGGSWLDRWVDYAPSPTSTSASASTSTMAAAKGASRSGSGTRTGTVRSRLSSRPSRLAGAARALAALEAAPALPPPPCPVCGGRYSYHVALDASHGLGLLLATAEVDPSPPALSQPPPPQLPLAAPDASAPSANNTNNTNHTSSGSSSGSSSDATDDSEPLTLLLQSLPPDWEGGGAGLLVRGFHDIPLPSPSPSHRHQHPHQHQLHPMGTPAGIEGSGSSGSSAGCVASPARLSGLIAIGDVLVGIDSTPLCGPATAGATTGATAGAGGVGDGVGVGGCGRAALRAALAGGRGGQVLLHLRYGDVPRWMQGAEEGGAGERGNRGQHASTASTASTNPPPAAAGRAKQGQGQGQGHGEASPEIHFLGTIDEVISQPAAAAAAAVLTGLGLGPSGGMGGMGGMADAWEGAVSVLDATSPPHSPLPPAPIPAHSLPSLPLASVSAFLGIDAGPSPSPHQRAPTDTDIAWAMEGGEGGEGEGGGGLWAPRARRGLGFFRCRPACSRLIGLPLSAAPSRGRAAGAATDAVRARARARARGMARACLEAGKATGAGAGPGGMGLSAVAKGTALGVRVPLGLSVSGGVSGGVGSQRGESPRENAPAPLLSFAWAGLLPTPLPLPVPLSSSAPLPGPHIDLVALLSPPSCNSGSGSSGSSGGDSSGDSTPLHVCPQWRQKHTLRHAWALLVLAKLRRQSGGRAKGPGRSNDVEVSAKCLTELLLQAKAARVLARPPPDGSPGLAASAGAGAGAGGSRGMGGGGGGACPPLAPTAVAAIVKHHFPPVALTAQVALIVRLHLHHCPAAAHWTAPAAPPLLLPLLEAWAALLPAVDAPLAAPLLHRIHAPDTLASLPPAMLAAIGFCPSDADAGGPGEEQDWLATVRGLATLHVMLRSGEDAPQGQGGGAWTDARSSLYVATHAPHLLLAPLLLWCNAGNRPLSSAALALCPLGPQDERRVAAVQSVVLLALSDSAASSSSGSSSGVFGVGSSGGSARYGSSSNSTSSTRAGKTSSSSSWSQRGRPAEADSRSSRGRRLLQSAAEQAALSAGAATPLPAPSLDAGRAVAFEGLATLAVQRCLDDVLLTGQREGSASLGAEVAAACFPSLQPWQVRAVLGVAGPVPMGAPSTDALERYLLYLTALFRQGGAEGCAAEVRDWLHLSLSLQPAPSAEPAAGAGLIPPLPSLLPSGLCAAAAGEAVALLGGGVDAAAKCAGAGFVAAALLAFRLYFSAAVDGGEVAKGVKGVKGGEEGAAAWAALLACLRKADRDPERVAAVRLMWVCAVTDPPASAEAAAAKMALALDGRRALVAAALGEALTGVIFDLCAGV